MSFERPTDLSPTSRENVRADFHSLSPSLLTASHYHQDLDHQCQAHLFQAFLHQEVLSHLLACQWVLHLCQCHTNSKRLKCQEQLLQLLSPRQCRKLHTSPRPPEPYRRVAKYTSTRTAMYLTKKRELRIRNTLRLYLKLRPSRQYPHPLPLYLHNQQPLRLLLLLLLLPLQRKHLLPHQRKTAIPKSQEANVQGLQI